ncbi:MAG TPA: LicD family protein [Bacteroidales bacterium]|jgi:lipopolysaccharide cholinephosphotransferase|nr:LicD family protein [Paludibacteraceae bacterium]NCA78851.1 LicD family protein [Sphingobacteriia bacterium]HOS16944.1 LicD family protein [Bacteroidales bacterium]
MDFDIHLYKQKLISLLYEFDALSKKYNIRYYLYAGSALGAIRHQGIIPWDDDIDVVVPRPDYERLIELSKDKTLFNDVEIVSIYTDANYNYPFAKLYDKNTTLIESAKTMYVGGVFIDIFPLDGVPCDESEKIKHLHRYTKARCILLGLTEGRPAIKECTSFHKTLYRLKCDLYKLLFNKKKQILKCESIAKTYFYDASTLVCPFHSIYGYKDITKKDYFQQGRICDFDGLKVVCPLEAEKFLTGLYGDYMTPPPPNERYPHHQPYFINLERRMSLLEIQQITTTNNACFI